MQTPPVQEPFPIFTLASRYLLYDVDTVSHIRRNHNICGVLIGGLAQAAQQNVFLGLPLELMPEEARLLVEKGVAYIVDDVAEHKRGFLGHGLSAEEKRAYHAALRRQGVSAAVDASKAAERRSKEALEKKKTKQKSGQTVEGDSLNWNDIPHDMTKMSSTKAMSETVSSRDIEGQRHDRDEVGDDETIFASSAPPPPRPTSLRKPLRDSNSTSQTLSLTSADDVVPFAVTPTTSYPPLTATLAKDPSSGNLSNSTLESGAAAALPPAPSSYSIFKHLHAQGYFLAPGLRFGCQYMAYPGDPLRFHSHFLVNGMDWDQEFDLLDLVAGGRLGTGVKKGFLLGALDEDVRNPSSRDPETSPGSRVAAGGEVRAFCIEWAGM